MLAHTNPLIVAWSDNVFYCFVYWIHYWRFVDPPWQLLLCDGWCGAIWSPTCSPAKLLSYSYYYEHNRLCGVWLF